MSNPSVEQCQNKIEFYDECAADRERDADHFSFEGDRVRERAQAEAYRNIAAMWRELLIEVQELGVVE